MCPNARYGMLVIEVDPISKQFSADFKFVTLRSWGTGG